MTAKPEWEAGMGRNGGPEWGERSTLTPTSNNQQPNNQRPFSEVSRSPASTRLTPLTIPTELAAKVTMELPDGVHEAVYATLHTDGLR